MVTAAHRGPQDVFAENIHEFPDGGNQANARRFAIAKAAIIKAVRADKSIPARNRASVQNYVSLMSEGANRKIFNATGHLVTWIGVPSAPKTLGTTEHTVLRAREIAEPLGYLEIIAYGAPGRGNSNLCRVRVPGSENLSREEQEICREIAKNLSWRPSRPRI